MFDDLLISLSTIRDVLINSNDLICQEKSSRISPCQMIIPVIFSKIPNEENSWPSILRWMIDREFLQCLTVLIHLTILNQRQDLFNIIEEILREFFNWSDTLVFLAHQTSICTELLKSLFFAVSLTDDDDWKFVFVFRLGNEIRRREQRPGRATIALCFANFDVSRRFENV